MIITNKDGQRMYPYSNRNWHSIDTYGVAVRNRLWDACEDGNVDAMEHFQKLIDEYEEIMESVWWDGGAVTYVPGKYLSKLRDMESKVSALRCEGLARMGLEEYSVYC